MADEISKKTYMEQSEDQIKLEFEARKAEKKAPEAVDVLTADEMKDKASAVRLREVKRFLESIDCWNYANTGARIRFVWDEVKTFIVTDKDPSKIEDLSFLTTLRRELLQLHKMGQAPLIELHQRKQFPYQDNKGKMIPMYLLELEFVKPRETKPLKFTIVQVIQEPGVKEAIEAKKAELEAKAKAEAPAAE